MTQLIDTARTRGTPLLFGSAGNGSLQHLAGELLAKTVDAKFQHVPYRGSSQAITDLLAQRIDFIVDSPTAELEFIRAGKVRALAVTGTTRFFSLPDVLTTAEAGLPGYTFTSWQGLVAPAGLAGRDRATAQHRDCRSAGRAGDGRAHQVGRQSAEPFQSRRVQGAHRR